MKSFKIILIISIVISVCFLSGCKKEFPNVTNMFKVELTLHQSQTASMPETGEIYINTTDSVIIDYTISSPDADMYQVALYKAGGTGPVQRIPITEGMDRRTYSGQFKFYAKDLGAGTSSYRIWANDINGVYLGDGYKKMTINVVSDLKYFSNKKIFAPDSVAKVLPCYASLNDGKLYSYTTGAANSANIDMGIFARFDTTKSGNTITIKKNYYLYSLSASPLPFQHYDISSWTKRSTLFSAVVTSGANANNFKSMFSTAPKIEEQAKSKTINLSFVPTPLASNQFIYFKNPEGKYGVLFIQSINTDYLYNPYILFAYRMQE